jgi:hypothetical protein
MLYSHRDNDPSTSRWIATANTRIGGEQSTTLEIAFIKDDAALLHAIAQCLCDTMVSADQLTITRNPLFKPPGV